MDQSNPSSSYSFKGSIHFFLWFLLPIISYSQSLENSGPHHMVSWYSAYESVDTLEICNVKEAICHYSYCGFYLDTVRKYKKVPRVFVHNFPKDIKYATYQQKKHLFMGTILAAILKANEEILWDRTEIECLMQKDTLSGHDSLFLKEISRKYYASSFEEMLQKVDVLPPSLVIAQGINESGWGTSFFALNANSVFGMKAPPKSSLPTIKHPVHSFKTYKFSTLEEGIKEYILNLNRHRLYKPLRDIRYAKRKNNEPLYGKSLLVGMKRYSSRGQAYLNTISKVIKTYDLQEFDNCRLDGGKALYLIAR